MKFAALSLLLTLYCYQSHAEDVRLLDLEPTDAQQYIEQQDTSLKYAPKIESNVPAVRYLGNEPHNVLEDIYLANQYHGQDGLGGYLYGYSVPDIAKTEKKKAGGDLRGAYNYIAGNGKEIKVEYWDDGTGFHQVDNVDKNLPEDLPEVKAAKEEHLRLWQEEAERNSHPVQSPYNSEGQYASGPLSAQGQQQLASQQQHQQQPYQPHYNTHYQGAFSQQQSQVVPQPNLGQPQQAQVQQTYPQQKTGYQSQNYAQTQGSNAQPQKSYNQPQATYSQPQGSYSQPQGSYSQPQGSNSAAQAAQASESVSTRYQGAPSQHQGAQSQHQGAQSQHQGAQNQHQGAQSQPQGAQSNGQVQYQASASETTQNKYQGQYKAHQSAYPGQQQQYQAQPTQTQYTYSQQGSSSQGQTPRAHQAQYSGNDQQQDGEDDGEYKPESEEENGPPRGFFYKFDYPVGIIVDKQGKANVGGHVQKRESNLRSIYESNKEEFESQLRGFRGEASGYLVV